MRLGRACTAWILGLVALGLLIAPIAAGQQDPDAPAGEDAAEEADPPPADPPPATDERDSFREDEAAKPEPGDPVRLIYVDGRRLRGTLVREDADEIIVTIERVDVRIGKSELRHWYKAEDPRTMYRRWRPLIGSDDLDQLVSLATWLKDERLYDEALLELDAVLARDPYHAEAAKLRDVVRNLMTLEKRQEERELLDPHRDQPPGHPAVAPRRLARDAFPLLSPEQINLMKVYEVDLNDPPRMVIARETVDKLLDRYADHPLIPGSRKEREAFRRLPPEEILDIMFRVQARELYGEVSVIGQPRAMSYFRDRIHTGWLLNSAATTRCHGGLEAGQLVLMNRRPNSEQTVYTNFLILDRFRTSDGLPMINYANPEKSVLVQMGLPRKDALYPHPPVRGWRPVFRSRESRSFKNTLEWIGMMYEPRPDYPIQYDPPRGEPTGILDDPAQQDDPLPPAEEPVVR